MGKGDKKSRRGKITIGSFGVRRPKKKIKTAVLKSDAKVKDVKTKTKVLSKEKKEVRTNKEIKEKKEIPEEPKAKAPVKKKPVE